MYSNKYFANASRGVCLSVLSKDNITHQSELVAGAEVKVLMDTCEEAREVDGFLVADGLYMTEVSMQGFVLYTGHPGLPMMMMSEVHYRVTLAISYMEIGEDQFSTTVSPYYSMEESTERTSGHQSIRRKFITLPELENFLLCETSSTTKDGEEAYLWEKSYPFEDDNLKSGDDMISLRRLCLRETS